MVEIHNNQFLKCVCVYQPDNNKGKKEYIEQSKKKFVLQIKVVTKTPTQMKLAITC